MVDYGDTWIQFYKIETKKSLRFVSPPTPKLFFYLLEKVFKSEGVKKNEPLILGFPGVVKNGKILSAPYLEEKAWQKINLTKRLAKMKVSCHVMNDTDLHGHLVIKGKGTELVLSLDTAFGSSLFTQGLLVPNTDLGHHLLFKKKSYKECLGYKSFLRSGKPTWIKNLKKAVEQLNQTFNPDVIYLTGSLSLQLKKQRLPKNTHIVGNPVPNAKLFKGIRLS